MDIMQWLQEYLKDNGGTAKALDVQKAAFDLGISVHSLNKAKDKLGVRSRRRAGLGESGYWEWYIPELTNLSIPDLTLADYAKSTNPRIIELLNDKLTLQERNVIEKQLMEQRDEINTLLHVLKLRRRIGY